LNSLVENRLGGNQRGRDLEYRISSVVGPRDQARFHRPVASDPERLQRSGYDTRSA